MNEPLLSNSANVPLEEMAAEDARLAIAPLQERQKQVIEALGKSQTIADDEELRRAADKLALSKALIEASDTALEPIGGPYRNAAFAVRNVALTFTEPLKSAESRVRAAMDAFRDRQRQAAAKAANEQAQRERELRIQAGLAVQEKPAEVKPADVRLGSVRSDYRAQVFDRKVTKVAIVDPRALPDEVLNSPGVTRALETAVRQLAKLKTDIPGATVEFDQAASVKVR
jgi:hypothetical protein